MCIQPQSVFQHKDIGFPSDESDNPNTLLGWLRRQLVPKKNNPACKEETK